MAAYYGNTNDAQNQSIITTASNIIDGTNPPFLISDFLSMYPLFIGNVSTDVIQMYVDFAMAVVKKARYHSQWKICVCWFVAHFLTLYLQSVTCPDAPAAMVVAVGQAKGLTTSKSVGNVSVGIDYSQIGNDLNGWAQWKLTVYGQQFASTAKLMARGGSYIW